MAYFTPLPPLEPTPISTELDAILPIYPHFFVSRLTDKPQNPILHTLELAAVNKTNHVQKSRNLKPSTSIPVPQRPKSPESQVWDIRKTRNPGPTNQVLSWDELRPSRPTQATPTAFLSEQHDLVIAAARYHAQPRLNDPTSCRLYVSESDLLDALKMTLLGTSSVYHTWDSNEESFVPILMTDGRKVVLLVGGQDERICESFTSRFMNIGTMVRRMELFTGSLRASSLREGPTIHAFAHSLSAVLSFLRDSLAHGPLPAEDMGDDEQRNFSAIWMHHSRFEEMLTALSSLYGRGIGIHPRDYPTLETSPISLLSRIYAALEESVNQRRPKYIPATFAFILTNTSQEYFRQISRSVGYGAQWTTTAPGARPDRADDDADSLAEENETDPAFETPQLEEGFPSFFPHDLVDILPAAQKSLTLLRGARPNHPLLTAPKPDTAIRWLWTVDDIQAAWDETLKPAEEKSSEDSELEPMPEAAKKYKSDLSDFWIYDVEPGSHLEGIVKSHSASTTASPPPSEFIISFPDELPAITPTLSHLIELVFTPLTQHASTLSSALLSIYLESTASNLNFHAHVKLLRSYLLLTAHPFRSRLQAALFSDAEDRDYEVESARFSLKSLRRKPPVLGLGQNGTQPWAVGLAAALLERETWPPVGADLSFFLRTVIVDSLETGKLREKEEEAGVEIKETGEELVLEEAEYRLGFAIRDLPVGVGRDKWLDPLCIEALDFLYMDYKPPRPVQVLITSEILSKYQRMSAFLLRLMRVETAVLALFRMTRPTTNPLFPTLARANKLLLHFRFVAQSFVSNLSSYIFDTAIGGNIDPFLSRLSASAAGDRKGLQPTRVMFDGSPSSFTDVFALSETHSNVLDDVLSASLLRSGQRGAGDLMRGALENVLELTVLAGERQRGRVEEYQAAIALEELYEKFRETMGVLTKVLRGLEDKNEQLNILPSLTIREKDVIRPAGGTPALRHLLLKLDLGGWWGRDCSQVGR